MKRITKEESKMYKDELKERILNYGYWSNEVKTFNDLGQKLYGYTKWIELHNDVKSQLN